MHPEEPTGYQQPAYTPFTDPARRGKVIAVVGGIILFIVLIIVGLVIVASSGSTSGSGYVTLAAEHRELLRIVTDHEGKARSLDSQNYFARASLLLYSSNQNMTQYLAERHNTGVTVEATALAANPDIDDKLESAKIANRFDEDFKTEFGTELGSAKRQAERLLDEAAADVDKDLLNQMIAVYNSLEKF